MKFEIDCKRLAAMSAANFAYALALTSRSTDRVVALSAVVGQQEHLRPPRQQSLYNPFAGAGPLPARTPDRWLHSRFSQTLSEFVHARRPAP